MLPFRSQLAAAGLLTMSSGSGVNWSSYNASGDKTASVFSTANTQFCIVIPIDSTRAMITYRGTSNYARACIASIDGSGNVSFGTETVLLSATISGMHGALLDSGHVAVAVESGGDVKLIVAAFSGTTISSVGTAVSLVTTNSDDLMVAVLSSSKVLVALEDQTNTKGRVFYATVSGTTVTAGSGFDFKSTGVNRLSMAAIGGEKAIICYQDASASKGQVQLLSVSGSTPQSDYTLSNINGTDNIGVTAMVKLSNSSVLLAFEDVISPINSAAVVISESSGSLSLGTAATFTSDDIEWVGVALPNSTRAVVSYSVNNSKIASVVIEISGTSLTALSTHTNETGDKEYINNGNLGTDYVLIAYTDDDNASKGTAKVITV